MSIRCPRSLHPLREAGARHRASRSTGRLPIAFLLAGILAGFAAGSADAQEREVQTAVDVDGEVLELTPELRGATGLVPDVSAFQYARIFEREDGSLVLEVSWSENGRIVRERSPLSATEAAAFRQRVSEALAGLEASPTLVRDGRGGLVWGATGLGLGFYGWALPVAFDVDDGRTAVATYLLTAASSFYLPYRLTRNRSVTDAHRSLALWGATRGALYGGTLGLGLAERGGTLEFEDDDDDEWRVALGAATLGSLAGGVLGFKTVDWTGIDRGTAQMRGTLVDFSTAAGFGLAYTLGLYDDEEVAGSGEFPTYEQADLLPGNLLALAVTGAGAWGASSVGRGGTYTPGDVHVLRSFGIMGAQALLPIANLVDEDEGKTHVAAAIAGAAPGLFMGNRLLRTQSFSSGDGVLVAAGHLAGGLLGAGLTYLVDPASERNGLIYLTTTALGSAAGLAFTYRALADDGAGSGSASRLEEPRRRGDVAVSVNPTGLLPIFVGGSANGPEMRTPLLTVRW